MNIEIAQIVVAAYFLIGAFVAGYGFHWDTTSWPAGSLTWLSRSLGLLGWLAIGSIWPFAAIVFVKWATDPPEQIRDVEE